ncbi:XRE family transcriptional regulator [Xanthobacter sp. DSM 24535]|uniref:ImmA/IrrE family metallo-endopeptidase n=1 Tax=Roseixanthobacter psychrophilus TaxID=3119917 RepID=UPI00372BF483
MAKALINGDVLRWARERAALPVEEVAGRMKQDVERVIAWETGEDQPTFRQAQTVANLVHVPFGFLFLPAPPQEALPLPDLRTVGSAPAGQLDLNTRDLLRDVMFKHDWFVEVLEEQGHERLPFVGRFSVRSNPVDVATDMRSTLGVAGEARVASNWEAYLRVLMRRAEDAGTWVMRSGIVGSNTHRALNVGQFRGFAISHPIAPLVFINGRDAQAAQIFTLVHELAHIWIGSSGISNVQIGRPDYGTNRQTEVFCNKVAAEFLVPAEQFAEQWSPQQQPATNYDRLARYFKVSKVVIARRAFDLGKIQEPVYSRFYREQEADWEHQSDDSNGGNFYLSLPIRNGRRFTYEVASRAVAGRTLFREAAALLNVKPASIPAVFKRAAAL